MYVFTGTQCILQPRAESRPDSDPRTISQSLHAVNLVRLLVSSSSVSGGCPRAETLWTRRHSVERTLPATPQQSSLCAKYRKDDSKFTNMIVLEWFGSSAMSPFQRTQHTRLVSPFRETVFLSCTVSEIWRVTGRNCKKNSNLRITTWCPCWGSSPCDVHYSGPQTFTKIA